jgi:hypothetical protein
MRLTLERVRKRVALRGAVPVAVLHGLAALVRTDVIHEGSACHFRKALRLNRLLTQANEIDARFP